MSRIRTNFVAGLLDAGINSSATSVTSSASTGASGLPGLAAVTGSDTAVIVLDPDRLAGAPEIVYVTAHTAASGTATISRGAEGTTARAHLIGTKWVHAATKTDLENFGITPSILTATGVAEGTSTSYARGDHSHSISTDAAVAIGANSSNTAGTATTMARSDHTHDVATAIVTTLVPDQANAEGVSNNLARSDHVHGIAAAAPATTLDASTSLAEGVSTSFARSDHTHAVAAYAGVPGSVTAGTPTAGASTSFSKGDHTHALPVAAPRGLVAPRATVSTSQGPIGATDTVLVSIGSTACGANREFELIGTWRSVLGTVVGDIFGFRLYVDGLILNEQLVRVSQTTYGTEGSTIAAFYTTGSATNHTFQMSCLRLAGSGLIAVEALGVFPITLVVKDIGGT